MFSLFEPTDRRIRDDQDVNYFYDKYGVKAPDVLNRRAADSTLSSRDRRHWRRLARKARRQQSKWIDSLRTS